MTKEKLLTLQKTDVEWCYQHFFGRPPESEEVVEWHLNHSKNLRQLVEVLTRSREYEYKKYNHAPPLEDQSELHYFFHIHKTGGMSIHEYLHDAVPAGELLPGYLKKDILNIGTPNSFRYLSGHFGGVPLMLQGRRLRMATLLRNPVQRGLSHYKHARREKENVILSDGYGDFYKKIHKEIMNSSLEEFLYSPFASMVFGNHQACQLADLTDSSLLLIKRFSDNGITAEELYDLAIKGLSKMELVGITEKLEEFISCLADRWNLPKPVKDYVVNSDPAKERKQLTQNQIKRIRELCAVDIRIYDHVKHS